MTFLSVVMILVSLVCGVAMLIEGTKEPVNPFEVVAGFEAITIAALVLIQDWEGVDGDD